jgi:hypothetical protein
MRSMVTMTTTMLLAAGMVLAALALSPHNPKVPSRDKTGTMGVLPPKGMSQTQKSQPLTMAGSFGTERTGFEPVVRFSPHTGLAIRPPGNPTGAGLEIAYFLGGPALAPAWKWGPTGLEMGSQHNS